MTLIRFLLLVFFSSTLMAQDVASEMARIAAIPDEAAAREEFQAYFRGSAVLQAAVTSAREATRARAESGDNAAARLRAGSARMFRELGSTNLRGGATSAVARTSATEFLSFALESGAVTSKTDQSTATFQLNALATWQLITGRGAPYGCGGIQTRRDGTGVCEKGPGFWLRGLTGSVSLNVNSKETAVPVLATTTGDQTVVAGIRVLSNPSKLSALGIKYELFQREKDPEEQEKALNRIAEDLNKSLDESSLLLNLQASMDKIILNSDGTEREDYRDWVKDSVDGAMKIRSDPDALERYAHGRLEIIVAHMLFAIPDLAEDLAKIQNAYDSYVSKMAKLEAEQLFKKSLAFDFVHTRPTDQPFFNTVRLDFNTPLGAHSDDNKTGASASLDVNAAFSFYHESQMVDGKNIRLRDASVSAALNYRMPSWGALGSPVLTLAGYYQYMFENGLIQFESEAFTPGASHVALSGPAMQVLNTKGSIGVGQLRLEIPLGEDSGVSFPIALSYANRTELVKDPNKSFWQGQIGISYDLSKLQEAFLKRKRD